MRTIYIFLVFLFLILPVQVLSQTLIGGECSATYVRSIKNSILPTNFTADGYCKYPDGTKSASSLTCFETNCCERYLTGIHTKGGIEYKSWRYINQLNCVDLSGKSKMYINGKDADIPTTINATTVNIAETHGNNSPAFAGNDNSFEQTTNADSESKWYKNLLIQILSGLVVTFLVYKFGWNHISPIFLKRKADAAIFQKLNVILPHKIYQYFIDDTWNMQYSSEYLNSYLDNYIQAVKDPTNLYHDKSLRLKRKDFDEALESLLMSVSTNFGFPNHQLYIMNLQTVASHETERYKKVFSEVRKLNSELCSYYDDYIKAAKERLII